MTRRTLTLLLVLFSQSSVWAQTAVLFVGNSYTYYNEMPNMVKRLAAVNKQDCDISVSVNGGVSLKDHWEGNAGLRTKTLIEENSIDFVIIQDQSMTPISYPNKTLVYGKKLSSLVKEQGGKVLIFQSWSRKHNPESQKQLDQTFEKLEKQTGARIAPIADAWYLAMREYPGLSLYMEDGSHPSPIGSYLTALVIYQTIFKPKREDFKVFDSNSLNLNDMKKCEWIANEVMKY